MLSIKKIFLLAVIIFLITTIPASAYDNKNVHPYLANEAAKVINDPEINSYLNFIKNGETDEDVTDHIYGRSGLTVSVTHFWDADMGDNWGVKEIITETPNTYPNAWQKAQRLWNLSLNEYRSCNKTKAYEYLGHVAHLLQDMTVPAHAHEDFHPGHGIPGGDDCYEDWITSNYKKWSSTDAIDEGGPVSIPPNQCPPDVDRNLYELYYLFYTANQVGDYFASDSNYNGDTVDRRGWMNYAGFPATPTLSTSLENNDDFGPFDDDNDRDGDLSNIGNKSMVYAIRATAALFQHYRNVTSQFNKTDEDECHGECAPEHGIARATDNQLTWTTSPNNPWIPQSEEYYNDGDAIQSAEEGLSWVNTEVIGPGKISYYSKTSGNDSNRLIFIIDNQYINFTFGETDWRKNEYQIKDGKHNLTWTFYCVDGQTVGFCDRNDTGKGYLDKVEFDYFEPPITEIVYPYNLTWHNGSKPNIYNWKYNESIPLIVKAIDVDGNVTNLKFEVKVDGNESNNNWTVLGNAVNYEQDTWMLEWNIIDINDGKYWIRSWAEDDTGRYATSKNIQVGIDREPPVIVIKFNESVDEGYNVDIECRDPLSDLEYCRAAILNTTQEPPELTLLDANPVFIPYNMLPLSIEVWAKDNAGNTANKTIDLYHLDSTPPAPISNLSVSVTSFGPYLNKINWTWDNPSDSDFSHCMIYIDGVFVTNTTYNFFTSTTDRGNITISIRTVDTSGNVNPEWVNQTTELTLPKYTVCHSLSCDFKTIQSAINSAKEGSTIVVKPGVYHENPIIDKTLTIIGEIDEDGKRPVIDLMGSNGILINSDEVTIDGFEIINSFTGIQIRSNTNRITNNTISDTIYGIKLYKANNNHIAKNTIKNSESRAIYISNSNSNVIDSNSISDCLEITMYKSYNNKFTSNTLSNVYNGFFVYKSDSNKFEKNTIITTQYYPKSKYSYSPKYGFRFYFSNGNDVSMNNLTARYGIYIYNSNENTYSANNIRDCVYYGSLVYYSDKNQFVNNILDNNLYGISNVYSDESTFIGNEFTNQQYGLFIYKSDNTIVKENSAKNNRFGSLIFYSKGNTIHGNEFVENGIYGLYFYNAHDTNFTNNVVMKSNYGLKMIHSSDNHFSGNTVEETNYGVSIMSMSNNNLFIKNDFLDNVVNGRDYCKNSWDDGMKGNHYSDFDEPEEGCYDEDDNGVCDSGYYIGKGEDRYPLITLS